jgi:hypothetical protein
MRWMVAVKVALVAVWVVGGVEENVVVVESAVDVVASGIDSGIEEEYEGDDDVAEEYDGVEAGCDEALRWVGAKVVKQTAMTTMLLTYLWWIDGGRIGPYG